MLVLLTGFLAGAGHVLAGPDHLAAIAPLAAREHRKPGSAGVRWGLGHSAGVLMVGVLFAALREALPLERIGWVGERMVGVVLIGVAIWTVRQALRLQVHAHVHTHDGDTHAHLHFHSPGHAHAPTLPPAEGAPSGHRHSHAAFGIGTLHGLAGSSHFLGVLPALALPSVGHTTIYLGAFAAGTVVAMGTVSWAIGVAGKRLAAGHGAAYRGLLYASAMAAFGIGLWWLRTGAA